MHCGTLELWNGLLELGVRAVEQDLIPYMGQLELANVPIEASIIDLGVHNSLIALVMFCNSLPTMDMLSTLV